MPRSAVGFPQEPSLFLLERNKFVVYEVSGCVAALGEDFVVAACVEVRQQRLTAGVSHKTWVDNYAKQLEVLLEGLALFCAELVPGRPAKDLTSPQWLSFAPWMSRRVQNQPLADITKAKQILALNNLLTRLAAAAVIPVRVELARMVPRTRARVGESHFAKKGWNHQGPAPQVHSSFAIRIDVHGRDYDYELYRPLGRHFLLCVVPSLGNYYGKYSAGHAKKLHNVVVDFLRFLAHERQSGNFSQLFAQLEVTAFATISGPIWEHALYGWRDTQLSTDEGPKTGAPLLTAHTRVKALNGVWQHLAAANLVPEVMVVGFKNAKKKSGTRNRPSLAQLAPQTVEVVSAESALFARIGKFFEASEQKEVHEFIRSLCHALPPYRVQEMSMSTLVDEIHALNAKRLQDLRGSAEADFIRWHAHWVKGQAILARNELSAETLIDLLDSPLRSVSERRRHSSDLLLGKQDDARLGNALQYVIATQGGIASGVHGRYHHIMRNFGGRFEFHANLHPHPHATLALWVLLLIDTGANCEVVRKMPFQCIQDTNDARTRRIVFAAKERSGGNVIVDELYIDPTPGTTLSALDAVARYQQMSARYRAVADEDSAKHLFLHEYKAAVHPLEEWTARGWFIAMTERHASLAGLNARPSFIRPSVLLDVQNRRVDGAVAAQAVADHISVSTTLTHYTGRIPTKLQYAHKIREFQDRFQAVIIASIDGAATKLGLSEEEFQRIFSDAARTGLGVACLNPKAGAQPGTKAGQDCTRLDACHGCEMRWVVGTVANIADLMLFNEYLTASQNEAHVLHPDSWERRWLPWLVFSNIALTKLGQGETAAAFVEAKRLARNRRPTYQPFPLF